VSISVIVFLVANMFFFTIYELVLHKNLTYNILHTEDY